MKRSLWLTAFLICYPLIVLLCISTGKPFIFSPVDYRFSAFLQLAVFIAVLCWLLVYIALPVLKSGLDRLHKKPRSEAFFVIGAFGILQVVTVILGYTESSLTGSADPFYYYKGVGNTTVYCIAGNLTTLVIASIYNRKIAEAAKEKEEQALSFREEKDKSGSFTKHRS